MRLSAMPWICAITLMLANAAWAQDPDAPDPSDVLTDEFEEGVVVEEPFVAGIEANTWEFGFQLGQVNWNRTLLEASAIVVDVENPTDAVFADMVIKGDQAFSPQVKIGRTFGEHFAFENTVSFAVGDFRQGTSGEQEKWTNASSVNTLTDLEIEKGSFFTWSHDHAITYYPRSRGRVLPYLSVGAGSQHFQLDSDYVGDNASSFQLSYGGGMRIVADDLFSFRIDIRNYASTMQFDVDESFRDVVSLQGDAVVRFPVGTLVDTDSLDPELVDALIRQLNLPEDLPTPDQLPVPVASFAEQSLNNLYISVGFVAAF